MPRLVEHFRAKDLLLVPGLLSLARLPLAAAFPFTIPLPWLAFAVLVTASVTDVLDGWYARRFEQATPAGAVIDPVTDKLFVLSVMVTLLLHHELPIAGAVLLSTREIGELPLVGWFAVSHAARRARAAKAIANLPGKLVTSLQLVTVTAALFHSTFVAPLLYVTAAAGVGAAIAYWTRELRAVRAARSGDRY